MFPNPEDHVSENMKSVSDLYEAEVLLAYFLNRSERPCTPAQLTEIATAEGVINYFVYNEAIEKMIENGSLILTEKEGTEVYELTEKGRNGANELKKIVLKSIRDRIYAAGLRLFAKLRSESSVDCQIEPLEKGCSVHTRFKDKNAELMDISIYATDEDQAAFIKSKIMKDPSGFYGKIIDYVISNEEYVPDITTEE